MSKFHIERNHMSHGLIILQGLCLEIPGPTLIDLKITFNSSYEEITRSVSARGVGVFLGALVAGLFVDILGPNKDWLITLSQTMFTVAIVLTPFVRDLTVLWLLFFTLGSAAGMANVCKYFSTVCTTLSYQ